MALRQIKITEVEIETNVASSDYVIAVVGGKLKRFPMTSIESIVADNATDELKPKIEYPDSDSIILEKYTEYRYAYPGAAKIQVVLPTNSDLVPDFIATLVFRSPEFPTEFTYDSSVIFTGDDCEEGVFIPQANTVYDIVFWYNGYCYNAAVRGVQQ